MTQQTIALTGFVEIYTSAIKIFVEVQKKVLR